MAASASSDAIAQLVDFYQRVAGRGLMRTATIVISVLIVLLIEMVVIGSAGLHGVEQGRWQCINHPTDSECQVLVGKPKP